MAVTPAMQPEAMGAGAQLVAKLEGDGLSGHAHLCALVSGQGRDLSRDLCDAVHLLCSLYGSHPGLVELALGNYAPGRNPDGPSSDVTTRAWLSDASDAFERERLYLVRLTAAIGPLPSTPGAAVTEATLVAQRHALETLARSERRGTALGASSALLDDWRHLRPLLDRGAARVGMDVPVSLLPGRDSIRLAADASANSLAVERALRFGCEQLLLQDRGLFDLLEARSKARADG